MNFVVYFVLMSSPLFISGDPNPPPLTEADIQQIVNEGSLLITDSKWNKHKLKLLDGGKLGENEKVIVWKGKYDRKTVAVKIVWNEGSYNDEVEIYSALGAMTNTKTIEEKGVPRIYYHGQFLSDYFCIIMTLFDGTLQDRYEIQGKHLSNLTILLIFRRLIEILKFIHSKNVIHNDLKPQNIFLRGSDVFIGDFDVATLDGKQNKHGSPFFASKNAYNNSDRYEMDDIEGLVYTMWYLSSMHMSPCEGLALLNHWGTDAELRMLEKCKHYTDKDVRSPIEHVCTKEIISDRTIPNYDEIIEEFDDAIIKVVEKTGQFEFEWLRAGSSSIPSTSYDTATPSAIINQATRTIPIISTRAQRSPSDKPVRVLDKKPSFIDKLGKKMMKCKSKLKSINLD